MYINSFASEVYYALCVFFFIEFILNAQVLFVILEYWYNKKKNIYKNRVFFIREEYLLARMVITGK